MTPDHINSMFLLAGGSLNFLNVRRILVDRSVAGVSPWPTLMFFLWGLWDCYYFPHLDQWWSLGGTMVACLPNGMWLYFYFKYRKVA